MPNVFALDNRLALPTFDRPEALIAVAPDGEDAVSAATSRLTLIRAHLTTSRLELEALDARLVLRPAQPAPRTLQELAREARRRLAEERQQAARGQLEVRRVAVDRLAAALETP